MDLQLKKLRTIKGLSQEDMAEQLGIKKSRYGTWERGERTMSFPQAVACAEVLDCTTDALAGREVSTGRYTDKRQTDLNKNYEALTDEGKDAALGAVRGIRASESARANEEGPTNSEQVSA